MPGKPRSPVLRMTEFIGKLDKEVKPVVMAILTEDEDHPASKIVKYFNDQTVKTARAVLDIATQRLNDRDPDYTKPGRKAATPSYEEGDGSAPSTEATAPAAQPAPASPIAATGGGKRRNK